MTVAYTHAVRVNDRQNRPVHVQWCTSRHEAETYAAHVRQCDATLRPAILSGGFLHA